MQNSEEERWKTFQSLNGTVKESSEGMQQVSAWPLCGQQPEQHSSLPCFSLVHCRSRSDHTGPEAALARRGKSESCPSHSPVTQGHKEHSVHVPDSHRWCGESGRAYTMFSGATVCKLCNFRLRGLNTYRELAPLTVSAAEGLHAAWATCSSHARPEVCSVCRIPRDDLHSRRLGSRL